MYFMLLRKNKFKLYEVLIKLKNWIFKWSALFVDSLSTDPIRIRR